MAKERIRLLVLIDRYHPLLGGAQNNTRGLLRHLDRDRFEITVVTRRVGERLEASTEIDGIRVRRYGYSPVRILSKFLFFLGALRHLVIHRNEYDLIFCVPCTQITDFLPAYFASLITRKPYMFRTTSEDSLDIMLRPDLRSLPGLVKLLVAPPILWRLAIERAAALVNINLVLHERALQYGFDHCELIWHGVDTKRFRPADAAEQRRLRESLSLERDKTLIVCVGRYFVTKNQIALLRAVLRLRERGYEDRLSVVIIGATEDNQMHCNEADLREFVGRHDLGGTVHFYNDVRNVEDYLRASDLLVFPSLYNEGMSNVIIEAMLCALPIVATGMPQVRCAFPPGDGIFFEGKDVDALAGHLAELLDSEGKRRAYGERLGAYAWERYSVERAAGEYEELFRRALGEPPAEGRPDR